MNDGIRVLLQHVRNDNAELCKIIRSLLQKIILKCMRCRHCDDLGRLPTGDGFGVDVGIPEQPVFIFPAY